MVEELAIQLQGYDEASQDFLLRGFSLRFRLNCLHEPTSGESNNHSSVNEQIEIASKKLSHELELGRIKGPFDHPPFDNFICSPLGLIPKSVPGKFRLIHDLSFTKHNSVNLGIPKEFATVQYDGIDQVVELVKHFDQG